MKIRLPLAVLTALAAVTICAGRGEETPKGWFHAGSRPKDYEMSVDRKTSHGGKCSAHLKSIVSQTSGFGTIPNALASLVVPCQIPALIFVSERGTLGEFNLGQALVCKTMRPVLNSLAVENITITRQDELAFTIDRSIKQAVATQAPVTFILSPLLTGGKVFGA